MSLSRTCSQCGNNGHNSRTCNDGENSIMIFGVRLTGGNNNNNNNNTNSFRKSASLNNLSQYEQPPPQDSNVADAGYVSDDVVHASSRTRERKRGVPWTEEEHKLFLLGLQKVGKGDWRGISRNFVKTRTPTQVASHAQKYFLRRHNQNRRRRRSSLFDITTDTVMESLTIMEGEQFQQEIAVPLPPPTPSVYPASHYGGISGTAFPIGLAPAALPVAGGERLITKPIRPTPMLPPSSKMANLNLKEKVSSSIQPLPLSLNLQYSSMPSKDSSPESSSRSSPSSSSSNFQAMSSGKYSGGGGDSNIISVA